MQGPDDTQDLTPSGRSPARGLFWASAMFYALIALEFFYMASPFAAYFYSVYGPGLDWLQQFGFSGWTIWFFLPHLVEETRSVFINKVETVGLVLFFGGFIGFAIGAYQVYRAKLAKSDEVKNGLYRHIRHPQYLALIIASFGLLLIWPRFLVLFSTCLVTLSYVLLAKAEEKICLRKYDGYAEYVAVTGRFLPRSWCLMSLPDMGGKWANVCLRIALFAVLVAALTGAAFAVRSLAINSMYTHEANQGVYLSVVEVSDEDLNLLASVAEQSELVGAKLERLAEDDRFLAYVLPTDMYVSEIPMHLPSGESFGHSVPSERDFNRYKIVFTRVVFSADRVPANGNIISHAINKYPLIEVHIDLRSRSVEAVFQPPAISFYPDVQVPIF